MGSMTWAPRVSSAMISVSLSWALTVDAQKIGLEVKEYAIPTNKNVPLPPMVPNLADIKVINYDFAKYGSSDVRKRLLERWDKDINAAVK